MSMWQDESSGGRRSGPGVDTARAPEPRRDGQPRSRREAREAERRAAEALAEGRMHPSGVVDFGNADPRGRIDPDQDFSAQNTADIWAALSRRADAPAPQQQAPEPPVEFRPRTPESFGRGPATGPSPVSGELLDRVRDAVLRREREPQVPPTARIPVQQQPVEPPISRRERRASQAAELTEDGMPAAWFSDAAPAAQVPAAFGGPQEYDEYEDYDDAPTAAISMGALDRAALEAQVPMTAPVSLPQFFVEPQGDDGLSFSSPTPVVTPGRHPFDVAEPDPAFLEPRGGETDDDYDDEPSPSAIPGWGAPAATAWSAVPEAPEQQPASWAPEQLGPPSEITDLAGFEALIRRARSAQTGQSAQAPQAAPRQAQQPRQAPLPWKEPEDDRAEHTGFLGLAATSNGSSGALILPKDPQPDLTQAVSGTGDIFITGSLNLPKRLATTGAPVASIDSPEVDRLYEAAQDDHAPGVAPVRASKAISGSGSTRSMVGGRRITANILPTVLAIVAGAMAIGVVALLVGSWVLKLF